MLCYLSVTSDLINAEVYGLLMLFYTEPCERVHLVLDWHRGVIRGHGENLLFQLKE